jgi:chromosome segregation ATPase
MDEGDHKEKIFTLQLTIHKLEEELTLYRNGTSVVELMELIHEKDVEIETLSIQNDEKTSKLKKLAKTSGEVLLKYENIQNELQKKQDTIYELELIINNLTREVEEKADFIEKEIKIKQKTFQNQLKEKDNKIGNLELTIWELKETLENSNNQCSSLKEEQENLEKQFQQKEAAFLEERNEKNNKIEELEVSVSSMKETLEASSKQLESYEEMNKRYKELIADNDETFAKLHKRCAVLVSEKNEKQRLLDLEKQELIKNIQQFRVSDYFFLSFFIVADCVSS